MQSLRALAARFECRARDPALWCDAYDGLHGCGRRKRRWVRREKEKGVCVCERETYKKLYQRNKENLIHSTHRRSMIWMGTDRGRVVVLDGLTGEIYRSMTITPMQSQVRKRLKGDSFDHAIRPSSQRTLRTSEYTPFSKAPRQIIMYGSSTRTGG